MTFDLEQGFFKTTAHVGLRLPNGVIVVNFWDGHDALEYNRKYCDGWGKVVIHHMTIDWVDTTNTT